mmetsp:Transcript_155881/g.498211  ORF Transcript_155881/g.498211 Transcript_155881/m.498211 type:complete len:219 (-) Transcript_155881:1423-2079(-)
MTGIHSLSCSAELQVVASWKGAGERVSILRGHVLELHVRRHLLLEELLISHLLLLCFPHPCSCCGWVGAACSVCRGLACLVEPQGCGLRPAGAETLAAGRHGFGDHHSRTTLCRATDLSCWHEWCGQHANCRVLSGGTVSVTVLRFLAGSGTFALCLCSVWRMSCGLWGLCLRGGRSTGSSRTARWRRSTSFTESASRPGRQNGPLLRRMCSGGCFRA